MDHKDYCSQILGNLGSINPEDIPLLLQCIVKWMDFRKNQMQIMILQRRLHNSLIMFWKSRQIHHKLREDFNGPKMMWLLEHIQSPYQFQRIFRIKLPTFFKLKEILYSGDNEPAQWLPDIELLLFLFWLSGGLSYKIVQKLVGISETVMRSMSKSVFDRLLKNVCRVITFSNKNYNNLSEEFSKLTESHIFGLAIGVLDTFHVLIDFPSLKEDLQYLNDQNEFSVQVQAVCDYKGALMDIAVGFPGSMLKPNILQCTPLYLGRLLPPPGYVLLSGKGYPCLQTPICIIPPVIEVDNKQKLTFNKHHRKVHSVMKKSIGQIFNRWRRIFSKPIMYPLPDITNITCACAMIHNISLEMEDAWPEQTQVHFSVNNEHISIVEGQISGEVTQTNMIHHTVIPEPLLVIVSSDSSEGDYSSEDEDDDFVPET